jgi:hypothetical protein
MSTEIGIMNAMFRIFSSFENFDELDWRLKNNETEAYSGKIAREISKSISFLEKYTEELSIVLYNAEPKSYYQLVYVHLSKVDEEIKKGNDFNEADELKVFLVKLAGALEMLKKIEHKTERKEKIFVTSLIRRLEPMIKKYNLKKAGIDEKYLKNKVEQIPFFQ